METNRFFVYEHWRPDTDECFYVGKGVISRTSLMARRNPHHQAIQKRLNRLGLKVIVRIANGPISEDDAFSKECELIRAWRICGAPLVNKTNGGEGVSGLIFSAEHRRKLGDVSRGRKRGPMSSEQKLKLSIANRGRPRHGIPHTQEAKDKIGAKARGRPSKLKGRPKSEVQKRKISKSLIGVGSGEKNPFWGRRHTEETKRIISEKKKLQIGWAHSEETKDRMREAWVRRKIREAKENSDKE